MTAAAFIVEWAIPGLALLLSVDESLRWRRTHRTPEEEHGTA